jgi:CDP-diglyceride synthetase
VFPEIGARGINRVSVERDWEFAVGGVMFLVLAALMIVIIWRAGA